MFLLLKKIIPNKVLLLLNKIREKMWSFIDQKKPYLNFIKYSGFNLYYNRANGLINRIRFGNVDRVYERKLSDCIIDELKNKKNKTFIDVGANIGLISLRVLAKLQNVKIYAFEPGFNQNRLFGITIFSNQISNKIVLFNEALDKSSGVKNFASHNDINNSGDGFIDTERGGNTNLIKVNTTTLDIWWEKNGKPSIDVVKIDTEGSELWILEGGEEFVKNCKPTIFLEISVLNLKNYPYKHFDVYDWLYKHDYELYTIDNKKCSRYDFDKIVINEDSFIARPKKI